MVNIIWFETLDELKHLTGLTSDELWDAGFNLDDWDFGVCSNDKLDINAYDYNKFKCGYYYLIGALTEYGMRAPKHTEHNGLHYYMSYHA